MDVFSWNLDLKNVFTPLCELSMQHGAGATRPTFTPLYHALFRNVRGASVCMGVIGVGRSDMLLAWSDYLQNARILGFDSDDDVLAHCALRAQAHTLKCGEMECRVAAYPLDVARQSPAEIETSLGLALYNVCARTGDVSACAPLFHVLLQSTGVDVANNSIDAQLRLIYGAHALLVPGGMLAIERIDPTVDESVFMSALAPLLAAGMIQDAYFVTMAARTLKAPGFPTTETYQDKVLVIVKGGGLPIFRNYRPVTIITPSCRPGNLAAAGASLPWDLVDKWYIVYDGARVSTNPRQFTTNPKVVEAVHKNKDSIAGNAQRNHALDLMAATGVTHTFLYFLDDDNTIHPALIRLLRSFACEDMLYSFNQHGRIRGTQLKRLKIDTAMVLLDAAKVGHLRWKLAPYIADGLYIEACAAVCKKDWIYIDNDLCSYNVLPR
jgi:hypothetical protein